MYQNHPFIYTVIYCNIYCSRYASEEFTVQNHISKSTKCIVHPYNHKTPGIYMDLGKVSTHHTVVLKTSYWDFSPLLNYRCCCVVHYSSNKSATTNAIAKRTHTVINITGLYHMFFRISPCVKVSNGWSRHLVQDLEDAVFIINSSPFHRLTCQYFSSLQSVYV